MGRPIWTIPIALAMAAPLLCAAQSADCPTAEAVILLSNRMVQDARAISRDVRAVRDLLPASLDARTRMSIEGFLTHVEHRAARLGDDIPELTAASVAPGRRAGRSYGAAAILAEALKSQHFDSDRAALMKLVYGYCSFTCGEAREVLKTYTFDTDRKEAALLLYPRLLDPERFDIALEAFTFESSKREVREKVKDLDPSAHTRG